MEIIKLNEYTIVFKYNEINDQPNLVYFFGSEKSILVDAGPSKRITKEVLDYLKENNLREPDYIIITHYHWDHSFGLSYYNGVSIGSSYTFKRLNDLAKIDFTKDKYISDKLINSFSKNHLLLEYKDLSTINIKNVDMILDEQMTIDLGGIASTIIPVNSSHTKGSLIVKCKDVIVLGDASCKKLIGNDFFEDVKLLRMFYQDIKMLDASIVIEGHTDAKSYQSFLFEIEEEINEGNQKLHVLLDNIDLIHTTVMGEERIIKNLKITTNPVDYCKSIILNNNSSIYKHGKNWYCEYEDIIITINSFSYTIITAHKIK